MSVRWNPSDLELRTTLLKTGRSLFRKPGQILAFLAAAVLLTVSIYLVSLYAGQFLAIVSRLVPPLFDQRLVTPPRAPFVLPAVTSLVIGTSLWVVTATVLAVQLANAAYDDRTVPMWPYFRRSIQLIPRASVLLLLMSVSVGVGLSLFVVPGVYLSIRMFVALPALIIGHHTPVGAIRESWRRTRGSESLIVILLSIFVILGVALSQVPVGGYFLAVSLVIPAALSASVFVYRNCRPD